MHLCSARVHTLLLVFLLVFCLWPVSLKGPQLENWRWVKKRIFPSLHNHMVTTPVRGLRDKRVTETGLK